MRSRADDPTPSRAEESACAEGRALTEALARAPETARGDGRSGPTPRAAKRSRLGAAVQLLGDESSEVRRALLAEFRRAGRAGRPALQRAARSDDARVRTQARQLLAQLSQEEVVRRLQRHATRELRDVAQLESPFFLLGRLDRPDLDARPYVKALDAMAREVRRRTSHVEDDLRRARTLVNYLGDELGFRGDVRAYKQPHDVFLHRVIERRQGLPLSLCTLYTFVARRCGLHTGIVPLPGHVMLRLYGPYNNLIVDPFHGGEARTQKDLDEYLRQHGLKFNPVWMHDAGPRHLLRRQVANLASSLRSVGRGARLLAPLQAQLSD